MQSFRLIVATSVALISFASALAAKADGLPPFEVYGDATACCETPGNYGNAYLTNNSPDLGTESHIEEGTNVATASISSVGGHPVLTASSSGDAGASAELRYYMQVTSTIGYVGGVNVIGLGSFTVGPSGSNFWSRVSAYVFQCTSSDCSTTSGPLVNLNTYVPDYSPGGTYQFNLDFTADVGTIYQITLEADSFDTATTTLDPIFTIEDPNAQFLSLDFSAGIPNGADATTPLPATLPLFASGLGALCLLGRRKGRVQAAR